MSRKMVKIPAKSVRSQIGRLCHVSWANPMATWKIMGVNGQTAILETRKGKELAVKIDDLCYFRGFEEPW